MAQNKLNEFFFFELNLKPVGKNQNWVYQSHAMQMSYIGFAEVTDLFLKNHS